jgi:putative thioredoxin
VVDEFVGAQGHEAVERFFDGLVPSQADLLVQSGSEEDLRHALELEPRRADAAVELARRLIERGEDEQALELLSAVNGSFQAEGLAARVRLQKEEQLSEAFAALDRGELERALELLLDALPSADGRRDDIRRVIVGVLDPLGPEHPVARDARRRLASLLF